jgi:hypothetical protein
MSNAGVGGSGPSYADGVLRWDNQSIKDEEIITVLQGDDSTGNGFKIASMRQGEDNTSFELRTAASTNPPQQFLNRWRFTGLPTYLDPNVTEIYVLVSTKSGTGLAIAFWEQLLKPFLALVGLSSSSLNVIQTESAETVRNFVKDTLLPKANQGTQQTVILLSGDGGIVDSVNAIEGVDNRSR